VSENQIAEIIKSHLESFSSVIARSVDNLAEQTAKNAEHTAKNTNDISKLETVVENLVEITKERDERLTKSVEKVMQSLSDASLESKQLAMEYQRLEHDRTKAKEDVETLYSKMSDMQNACDKNKEEHGKELTELKNKISKIYIIASTLAAVGMFGGWVIKVIISSIKVTS